MPGGTIINPGSPQEQLVQFSRDSVKVKQGDIIRVTTPGGGGYGDPLKRKVEGVRLDVQRGLVSLENAKGLYGVVLDKTSFGKTARYEVNLTATLELRERIRQSRDSLMLIDRGPYAKRMRELGRITYTDIPLPR